MSIEGLLRGRVLGERYRIEEVIGRGGMGAVYRAVDERLGREVAVKVVTLTSEDDDAQARLRARFHREARSAAALPHHPNVVPVYDFGTDAALGLDYLVMELLRGDDLATRLRHSGTPPLGTGLRILREAARGLAVGHRAGLIHRDVKPGNIFLARSPQQEEQVRVVDFGIAKLADEDETAGHLTQDGRAPHSPAYASPEQLRGLNQLTPASDVFSLGAVGFQLLTGQRPFSEIDRNRISLGVPVDVPSLRSHNPAIPRAVEQVVRRALAWEPAQRFQDAGTFAAALDDAVRTLRDQPLDPYLAPGAANDAAPAPSADQGTRALDAEPESDDHTLLVPSTPTDRPPPPAAPLQHSTPPGAPPERSGRRRLWLLLVLLLAGGAALAWWASEGSEPVATEDIPPPPEEVPTVTPTIEEEPPSTSEMELQAYMHNLEGWRLLREGRMEEALEQFRLATELSPESSDYRFNYGLTHLRMDSTEAAEEQLERAVRLDPTRPDAHYRLAEARLALGDTTAAAAALERVMELSADSAERSAASRLLQAIEAARP